ncbi:MAG: SDR family oxidoreductase [Methylobacillus sp.]|jgi:short-subunit dehydrogenase|nr:SDR family oxidoreductase [Methylobacillus sp.]
MSLAHKRILLTGATGGIGHPLAKLLAKKGARLALVDRNGDRQKEICEEITSGGGEAVGITLDLGLPHAPEKAVTSATQALGGIDILINNAGIIDFILFQQQSPERIAQIMHLNAIVPVQLSRAVLPQMLAQGAGRIVNIGSTFGSIGFPHHAVYCASKFAVRGFSEALRRELNDSGVEVTYIAPRATRTALNNAAAMHMMEANGIAMDDPVFVAQRIVRTIELGRKECYIGGPESIFARLNGILPRLVDSGLRKKTRVSHAFADRDAFNKT